MKISNPRHAGAGAIDCEVEHPDLGLIPYTATADAPDGFGKYVWEALQDRTDIAPETLSGAVVPTAVSKIQLVRAMRASALWESAKDALAQADADVQEDWDLAISIPRSDPIIAAFGAGLGLSDAEIDQVFIAAGDL